MVSLQPDTVTGDIVFVLQQKEHPKFKRKSDDLFFEHTLSLTEALCGFHFILTHLDGRQLLIKSQPGEVVKPGKSQIAVSEFGNTRLYGTGQLPDVSSCSQVQFVALLYLELSEHQHLY